MMQTSRPTSGLAERPETETAPTAAVVPLRPPAALQRSAGCAEIAFKRRGSATVLDHLYQSGCSKLRLPAREPGRPAEAVLINTAGGLTDGDRLQTGVRWGQGTAALVASQAAERIYRSRGAPATIATRLDIGDGARAAWLPQETILFDHGRVSRRTDADVAEGGRLLACESLVYGRAAMGERVESGAVLDAWRVRFAGRLVFADSLKLEGPIAEKLARATVTRGATAMATVLFVAANARDLVAAARAALEGAACFAGVSCIGPVLVARLIGQTGADLRHDLVCLLECLLQRLAGEGSNASLPRVWHC